MRYETIIKYKGKEVKIKVPYKAFEREFELPEFLKAIREFHNINIKQVHMVTDWETPDCDAFEKGLKPIPKFYLECFARGFKLPMKIKYLGIIEEQEQRKLFAERLKQLRIENEIPQMIAALDLGVARSTYACYETAKNTPDFDTLIKIADYFHTSLDYLTGRDEYINM